MRIRTLISSASLCGLMLTLAGVLAAQTFTVFEPPNSSNTGGSSINARGEITGSFSDTSTSTTRGFVRDNKGVITVFNPPNATRRCHL